MVMETSADARLEYGEPIVVELARSMPGEDRDLTAAPGVA
jgi:hypothetical protein